jgi:1-acyl-sn-glycerol-3-phosphate acyltransferase
LKRLFQHPVTLGLIRLYLKLRFRFRVEGLEHALAALQSGHGVLLAGNHTGLLDTLLVSVAFPQPVTFLMREEVVEWKGLGHLVKRANVLVLWRDQMTRQLRACMERLQNGEHMVIFPEGELTQTGELNPFNDGVGLLWYKGNATLLPFAIHGGYQAWKEGEWHATGVDVCLEFLPPIPPGNKCQRATLPEQLRQTIQTALNTKQDLIKLKQPIG